MTALARWASDDRHPRGDVPVLTRLLPAMVSLIALLPASLALQYGTDMGMLVPLLWLQALLLAFGGAALVTAAHTRLAPWESRAAPASARERVRTQLLSNLGLMIAIALPGPLALAAVLDWQARELRVLAGVPALLSAALSAGLVLSLSWQGRASRALALPALLLLALLAGSGAVRAVSRGELLQSLTILGCAGLLWCWLLSRRALAACAPPWPQPRPSAWWQRRWAHRVWRTVPVRTGANDYRRIGPWQLVFMMWFLPQFRMHASHMEWLSWGQAYTHAHQIAAFGASLLAIGVFAIVSLIAPPLHWRQRLAPGGAAAQRWACRLVLGSLLAYAGLVSVAMAMAAWTNRLPFWPVDASAWLSCMGDVLLVTSLVALRRGQGNTAKDSLLIVAGLALAASAALAGLAWLGVTPQRGAVWLLIQAALIVPMTCAAIRAWSRQDLHAISCNS
jgi:hypothetical protein